ncbi:MAG: Gfo/Idh/MocA family oxidoreductase, partial [Prevotellaceae bacterium]|nr:Gfo/Idh/MocA family oxidoreductase [Prevotellaceae bacterium]
MKRRDFLTSAALIGAGTTVGASSALLSSCGTQSSDKAKVYTPEELGMYSFVDVAPDGKPLKAALVGCGDRGTGAATQFLKSGPNVSIIALVDIFPDRMERCAQILKEKHNNEVPEANRFFGFDAYKKVLAMPEIDLVLLCTPTHFRPEQFKAAVDAGKHVFMEKPCAVDPTGIRTVIAAAKVATSKGLTVVTGNQRRHSRGYWEAYMQVRNGAIGEIVSG